jgi:hypothetical protein
MLVETTYACINLDCNHNEDDQMNHNDDVTGKTKPLRDRNAADAAGLHIFILQIVAAT